MQNKKLSMVTVLSPAFIEIWENSLLGVMIIDANCIIRYMNRLLIRTDDLQAEKILGRKMTDFYPIKKGSHLSIQTIETLKSTIKKTIIYYTHKNKLVNSLCSSFPLFSGGKVEGALHFSLNLQTSQTLIDQYKNKNPRTDMLHQLQKTVSYTFDSIIGDDIKIRDAVASAKSASLKDFSIFIWAETGCGKELFAQSIHNASARHDKPFVPINCAAIPENLLETTLFGTAKGAFTGAIEKAGLLEEAQGGTILLDELNSMSFDLQAKLLRASQEKRIRRVGALKEIPVDIRFISTCNILPSQALKEKKIRTDLFYRLAVAVIEIPALRDHISDIPVLCTHFLKQFSKRSNHDTSSMGTVVSVSNETYEIFNNYPWPGNVRELEHTLKTALTLCSDGNTIEQRHLSKFFMDNFKKFLHKQRNLEPEKDMEKILENSALPGLPELGNLTDHEVLLDAQSQGKICLNNTMKNIETVYIKKALAKAGNNVSKAGRFLNLSPQALRYKLERLGIYIPAE